MKPLTLRLLFLVSTHFLGGSLLAQKHFKLTINLSQPINPEKIEALLDDGKERKQIKLQSLTGKQMVLTGVYYSMYAAITLQSTTATGFVNEFFVGEKPGTVTFTISRPTDSPFANYSLQNVLDFEKEKKQMGDYTVAERKIARDYESRWGDTIFSRNYAAIGNYYFKILMPALARKKLEYIMAHPNSYYSFYSFRTDVAKPYVASWDSLLFVFNSFPDAFKYSDEGNYLNAFLLGRLSKQKGDTIDFVTKDIYKNTVMLSQFKGKKTVLLHFWATWCTPCMRELPALKAISNQYKGEDLQIISIALPTSKYADYLATISRFQMNWIHVYNDPALQNKYGRQSVPRICLVDKTGKLVYDNIGLGKNDDVQLNELKEKLKEVMHD
jgi:thiol-disulfide isomerase/thioredoxin